MHGDLKPENLLIDGNFKIKVADFGCASQGIFKQRKRFCGTPAYMAPEIRNDNSKKHDFRVDLWALGVILYELLHQELPYSEDDNVKVDFEREKLKILANIDPDAKDLIQCLLHISPDKRLPLEQVLKHSWMRRKKFAINSPDVTHAEEKNARKDMIQKQKKKVNSTEEQKDEMDTKKSILLPIVKCWYNNVRGTGDFGKKELKISAWNINGLRSIIRSTCLRDYIQTSNPDIICLQELKIDMETLITENIVDKLINNIKNDYSPYINCCRNQKGSSGILILTKTAPLNVQLGMGILKHDLEGRVITMEFQEFFLVGIYERRNFTKLLESGGLVDTFRHFNPFEKKWTYQNPLGKHRNEGRRLDYALVTNTMLSQIKDSLIIDAEGSDHFLIKLQIFPLGIFLLSLMDLLDKAAQINSGQQSASQTVSQILYNDTSL